MRICAPSSHLALNSRPTAVLSTHDTPPNDAPQLYPEDAGEIAIKARRVRPAGVGHLTALAAAAGKGREIELVRGA